MLYTRKGDTGTSGLYGTTERLPKHAAIYDALGTLDELNSLLGLVYNTALTQKSPVAAPVRNVQETLFIIQAELAGAQKILPSHAVDALEATIATFEAQIATPHEFIIPGATLLAAWCDYARTVARRAERVVSRLGETRAVGAPTLAYLNRLSSFLYAAARVSAAQEQKTELNPSY